MLWRALKSIEQGFYIDVGANDPNQDSVTKAFYELGWSGINLDPVPQWFKKLESERPRDINLEVAAGEQTAELKFYEIPDTGLSTIDRETAERHKLEQGCSFFDRTVAVRTLNDICAEFETSTIHFLKIDVEGFEKQVIKGVDFSKIRPWILVVESTQPTTQFQNQSDWEQILLSADYEFAYFDGLNRFYVAKERHDLLNSFETPPNIFDNFVFDETTVYCSQVTQSAKVNLKIATEALDKSNAKIHELTQQVEKFSGELAAVYRSTSWSVTRPLRKLKNFGQYALKLFKSLLVSPKSALFGAISWFLIRVLSFLSGRPQIKMMAVSYARKFPNVELRLRQLMGQREASSGIDSFFVIEKASQLTRRAGQICDELKTVVEVKHKGKDK